MRALRIFLTTRVLACLAAIAGFAAFPSRPAISQLGYVPGSYDKIFQLLFGVWERADGIWYLGIARGGYSPDPAAYAFFPLYPLLIRMVDTVSPFPPIFAALAVSNAAFLVALLLLDRLGREEIGEPATERALWFLALFPGSLFFLAPYTESLFLCLSAAVFLAARRNRWWIAGLAGAALALTRNLGAAIVLPLALEIWRDRKARGRFVPAHLASLALVPAGLALWIVYCWKSSGDALAFVHQQSQWQRGSALPWETLWGGIAQSWDYCLTYPGGSYLLEAWAMAGAVLLGTLALLRRTISPSLALWIWIGILPPLLAPFPGNLLMSCYRFVAVLFPIFFILGASVRRPSVDQAIRLSFATIYGVAVAMFVCNQYIY